MAKKTKSVYIRKSWVDKIPDISGYPSIYIRKGFKSRRIFFTVYSVNEYINRGRHDIPHSIERMNEKYPAFHVNLITNYFSWTNNFTIFTQHFLNFKILLWHPWSWDPSVLCYQCDSCNNQLDCKTLYQTPPPRFVLLEFWWVMLLSRILSSAFNTCSKRLMKSKNLSKD